MTTASRIVFGLWLVFVSSSASTPQASSEVEPKAQRIQELLDLTGSGDLGVQIMQGMLEPMKQAMPQVPAEWWDNFMAKVDPDDLNELVVPIYDKHFTDQEIDAMLEFYRTAVGRSIITKLPMVMQESMEAGQVWGQSLAEEASRDLAADGYELPEV